MFIQELKTTRIFKESKYFYLLQVYTTFTLRRLILTPTPSRHPVYLQPLATQLVLHSSSASEFSLTFIFSFKLLIKKLFSRKVILHLNKSIRIKLSCVTKHFAWLTEIIGKGILFESKINHIQCIMFSLSNKILSHLNEIINELKNFSSFHRLLSSVAKCLVDTWIHLNKFA